MPVAAVLREYLRLREPAPVQDAGRSSRRVLPNRTAPPLVATAVEVNVLRVVALEAAGVAASDAPVRAGVAASAATRRSEGHRAALAAVAEVRVASRRSEAVLTAHVVHRARETREVVATATAQPSPWLLAALALAERTDP